jgi:hypothetical protein
MDVLWHEHERRHTPAVSFGSGVDSSAQQQTAIIVGE